VELGQNEEEDWKEGGVEVVKAGYWGRQRRDWRVRRRECGFKE
jgi:hypothetical protein